MEYVPLGSTGLKVSRICLGTMTYGSKKWREWVLEEPESRPFIKQALEAGINFFDTADVYSEGESEKTLGQSLKNLNIARKEVVIATKVFGRVGPGRNDVGASRGHIMDAVDASLKRLQTDYIDLYQSHKDDPNTQLAETLEAYAHLIKQGKVRVIGASNYTADRLAQALDFADRDGYPRYQTIQPEYSLYSRLGYEAELAPLALERQVSCIGYFSLANGFLTGKYRREADLTQSARGQRSVGKYLNARGFKILAAMDKVAHEADTTLARVALAWLIAKPTVAAPIASATSLLQLEDLIAAPSLQLSADAMAILDEASAED